jgi:hypothetical protein
MANSGKAGSSLGLLTCLILPSSLLTFVGILALLTSCFHELKGSYVLQQPMLSYPPPAQASGLKAVEFVQNDQFWDMGPAGDDAWAGILPANGGFLRYRLPNGTAHFSGVTMFHQLHCLQILRSTLVALEQGKPISHDHNSQSVDHSVNPHLHWVHCLDYLRQVRYFLRQNILPVSLLKSYRE